MPAPQTAHLNIPIYDRNKNKTITSEEGHAPAPLRYKHVHKR